MRPKKDPGIRQEAFIGAATELFMEKGFEAVSIRDILDAVADKTASPSVFYYYFRSKDELYRACVNAVAQNYLSAMQEILSTDRKNPEEWMLALVGSMEKYLTNERNLLMTGTSTPNRLFILDMRAQVTEQICGMWVNVLPTAFGISFEETAKLAQFLSGGIGEMMFTFMLKKERNEQAVKALSRSIVRFSINTLGMTDQQKAQLLGALKG